jgi:hypothetical protein
VDSAQNLICISGNTIFNITGKTGPSMKAYRGRRSIVPLILDLGGFTSGK